MQSYFKLVPGEWQMGDLGYVGAEHFLYAPKHPTHANDPAWDMDSEFWTHLISFYRGRAENVINQIKAHAWAKTAFRSQYEALCQYYTIFKYDINRIANQK